MTLTFDLGYKKMPEGLNVRKNYEFNPLHLVRVVAKMWRAAAAETVYEGEGGHS